MRSRTRTVLLVASLTAAAACAPEPVASPPPSPTTSMRPAATTTTTAATTATTASTAVPATTSTTAAAAPTTTSTTAATAPTTTTSTTSPAAGVRLERVAALTQPIALVDAGGATLLVAQRDGIVMALRQGAAATRVLDISADTTAEGERGLLGLALSPERTRLYAGYTDKAGNTAVDEFAFTAPATVDAASRRRVLSVEQPFANHNGGQLAFGPDGLLYVALGDGGSAGDPQGNGQRLDTVLGKILRIDPRPGPGGAPYQVPADNPFVGVAGARPEIWISGVRNPWRFSFDRATGDLWIGDVGQNALEEIDRLPAGPGGAGKGANLGWSLYEGSRPFGSNTAPPAGLTGPVFEYGRSRGCSVTGGYVYRGAAIPSLVGAYVFGDFCESKVRTLRLDAAGRAVDEAPLGPTLPAGSLAAFGEDAAGELYVLSLAEGAVHKLVPGSR